MIENTIVDITPIQQFTTIMNICNQLKITCKKSRSYTGSVLWYDFMLFAIKCWKGNFSKDFVTTKKIKRNINNTMKKVTYPVFNTDFINICNRIK